jgi:NADPH-dependent curcumin reductase CurA
MCLARANNFGRIVACGAISTYNSGGANQGIKNYGKIVSGRLRYQGFIVVDHPDEYANARRDLSQWIAEGKLKKTETIIRGGIRKAEQALVDLYNGANTGKMIVEIKNHNESPSKL